MLKFFDVFCLGLNCIIGSGIFIFPGTLAALAGPASILAFAVCAALLALVALCYAELGGMFPGNGGSALYAREAFGLEAGFGVGFMAWAAAVLSWAAVAAAVPAQLAYFLPIFRLPLPTKLAAAACLGFFGLLNARGARPGARTVNALTVAKIVPLALFVLGGLSAVRASEFHPMYSGEHRFGYAIFLALWTLTGFEVAPVPAAESENPQRDVPRAVLYSLGSAAVFYMMIQAVAVGAYPQLARSGERPLAEAAGYAFGPWGARLLAAGGLLSMIGFVAGAALGEPRYLSAMGEHSFRRLRLDEIHPVWRTPARSIAATSAAATMLVLAFDMTRLIDLSNLAIVSQYVSTCVALAVLRVRRPAAARPFRVPAGPAVAAAGVAVSLWLATQVSAQEAAVSAAILAFGYAGRKLFS